MHTSHMSGTNVKACCAKMPGCTGRVDRLLHVHTPRHCCKQFTINDYCILNFYVVII